MSHSAYLSVFLPLLIAQVQFSSSFPDGAPGEACVKHRPNHGARSQPLETLPFLVQASASSFKPGDAIAVRIIGKPNVYFKGFFLQAHDERGRWIGSFEPTPFSVAHNECSMITHSENQEKEEVTLIWHPPKDAAGKVGFLASILKSYKQYWVDVPVPVTGESSGEASSTIQKYIRREDPE